VVGVRAIPLSRRPTSWYAAIFNPVAKLVNYPEGQMTDTTTPPIIIPPTIPATFSGTPPPPRRVPARTLEKWEAWRYWSSYWTWIYVSVGSLSSILSTLVAANTKKPFLPDYVGVGIACSAAVLTFVISALSAQSKAAAFETAGRELEKAVAAYETDLSVTEKSLGDAEQKGIDILNRLKPQ